MRRSQLLGTLAFILVGALPAAAAAKPPKPGKCSVASSGVASERGASAEWALVASALLALGLVRRARR